MLHLHPNSITTLAVFAYLCEAYLGVKPSVALFRHYYSLRVTAEERCSGCASFRLFDGVAGDIIPMVIPKKVEDFGTRWLLVDARFNCPRFAPPEAPTTKGPNWGRAEMSGP